MEYISNKKKKIEERKAVQLDTLLAKSRQEAEERWTNAQIKAAGFQSVLDYAVEQFTTHKEELEEEVITKTDKMIKERQSEIEKFLMAEKDEYLEKMGIQDD
jgi:uncharacterized protein YqeY